jgi:hypothetical protein
LHVPWETRVLSAQLSGQLGKSTGILRLIDVTEADADLVVRGKGELQADHPTTFFLAPFVSLLPLSAYAFP